jgi:hypothetical protein
MEDLDHTGAAPDLDALAAGHDRHAVGPAVTEASFAELYRAWSVALLLEGVVAGSRSARTGFLPRRPRPSLVVPDGPGESWDMVITGSHYVLVRGSPAKAVHIEVVGPASDELQVTAVPLPLDLPW